MQSLHVTTVCSKSNLLSLLNKVTDTMVLLIAQQMKTSVKIAIPIVQLLVVEYVD